MKQDKKRDFYNAIGLLEEINQKALDQAYIVQSKECEYDYELILLISSSHLEKIIKEECNKFIIIEEEGSGYIKLPNNLKMLIATCTIDYPLISINYKSK